MIFEFNDDSQKICHSADIVNYGIQCDICGNKFQSVSNINGRRYCAGCYYKTFMKDNQQTEIDQLKQQLDESFTEEDVNGLIEDRDKTIKFMQKELAEKDCRIEELEGQLAYECECNKQLVDLQKQLEEKQKTIDEINKEFVQAVHDWKALCAKKDEEIEKLKQQYTILENENGKLTTELIMGKYKKAQKEVSFGIQFAITELEKVKEQLDKEIMIMSNFDEMKKQLKYLVEILVYIQQRIKELKGEKDE